MPQVKSVEIESNKFLSSSLPTVDQLKQLGCYVSIVHNRRIRFVGQEENLSCLIEGILPIFDIREQKLQHGIVATGGNTEVEIKFPKGTVVRGIAECSKKEHFNRALGIKVAIAHALFRNQPTETLERESAQ